MRTGEVVAVCLKEGKGIPKQVQAMVTVGQYGVEGDYHAGEFSKRQGLEGQPNHRQVSILAQEVIDVLNRELSIEIPFGGLGENIVVKGLGDLSDIKKGDHLIFSTGVELEISDQIDPCKDLMAYHDQLPKRSYGKRGIIAKVLTIGTLEAGDTVQLQGGGH